MEADEEEVDVYPKEAELLPLGASVCQLCLKEFSNQSRLVMHLSKLHKIGTTAASSRDSVKRRFFCPVVECKYAKECHFPVIKQLRQHYQRVHLGRNLSCPICTTAKFSLQRDLRYHVRICSRRPPVPKLFQTSTCLGPSTDVLTAVQLRSVVDYVAVCTVKSSTPSESVQQYVSIAPKPVFRVSVKRPMMISFGTQTTVELSQNFGPCQLKKKKKSVVIRRRTISCQTDFVVTVSRVEVSGESFGHFVGPRQGQFDAFNDFFPYSGDPRHPPAMNAVGCMAVPMPAVQADFPCQTDYFPVVTADAAVMVDFHQSGIATQFPPFDACDYSQFDCSGEPGTSDYVSYGVDEVFGTNIETQTDMSELARMFAADLQSTIHMETQTAGLHVAFINDLNDTQTQTNLIDMMDAGFHSSVETQTWTNPNTL